MLGWGSEAYLIMHLWEGPKLWEVLGWYVCSEWELAQGSEAIV